MSEAETRGNDARKIVGMYIHQHWPYNRPYAARTWTKEDWRGYAGGLKQLGFNTILVWPMLEVMPDPLTASDEEYLRRLGGVIDMLHEELDMRVYACVCPNIISRNEEGTRATFQTRHYYYCEDLVNPGDPAALKRMIDWREKLLRPLKGLDGITIIDSDPGGYPNSPISEFVNLLGEHRKMLDRIRPGIELVYWMHVGWRCWGRLYEQGKLIFGTPEEHDETVTLLKELNPEPWGMANGLEYARKHGIEEKVISFNYGRIEGEPSFPMTNFTGQTAYEGAATDAPRGVMGNAQTHCVQLPNTFAFARGAQGKPVTDADYVAFAEELVPGHGELIVKGWSTLQTGEVEDRRAVATDLDAAAAKNPQTGPLRGLLFDDSQRFLTDLALMLRTRAAIEELARVTDIGENPKEALQRVVEDGGAWQARHGYQNNWYDPRLLGALRKLDSTPLNRALDVTYEAKGEFGGDHLAFETIRQNFARMETFTTRLLDAMRETLAAM